MIVLGIETTCDETAASLVRNGQEILSHSIASSADLHERYGGVFPELACRRHIDAIIPVIEEALVAPVDAIAIAKGPGLVGALLIGMQVAKGLKIAWNKPLIGVNHVEAHLYAAFMEHPSHSWQFPSLGIVLSGGHTFLVRIDAIGSYQLLGTTVDDAIGEAFDKVGILLGLTYPGGAKVERLAKEGDPKRFSFQAGKVKTHPIHFSFSGLKTSFLYATKGKTLTEQEKKDLAASFQEVAFTDIATKAALAIQNFPCKAI
ncbi:MAG: tRNA (adenosine(37)-N6)-threonylcarbamoyltransferase complex transferase subunit TsaD, partial [Chlamydiia bacterium]|nr:tRNA (adenosine(37)-N6)-threonylcarbamoyltransferase complex transferase subunit TsaD [Chlamydiia bacterium]